MRQEAHQPRQNDTYRTAETVQRTGASSVFFITERNPCGAALSLAEGIEIDLAELREDHCVMKLACRRIDGAGKRYSAGVFERERARPAFGHDGRACKIVGVSRRELRNMIVIAHPESWVAPLE